MTTQRYELRLTRMFVETDYEACHAIAEENPEGDWVKYEDYKALLEKHEALCRAHDNLCDYYNKLTEELANHEAPTRGFS